ncbi:c-type cytochrome biogenesis protein CcmI [Rhodoblastus sp.]|uniref:c-type cytochrome biogenesis protein CcmI n=1 Tax=Rhodoblastus sp. TaxID=1962975 RepID=UPI003F9E68C0
MFWIALAVMTVAAGLITLWPLAFAARVRGDSDSEIAFYTAQLAEIDRDVERGQLPSDEASAARAEAGRRLLAAKAAAATSTLEGNNGMRRRLAALGGFLLIAGVGAAAYAKSGRPDMPDAPLASREQQTAPQDPIAVAVAHIEADVAASPDNVKAWSTLAPAYLHLGRYADSVRAYRKLLQLTGEDSSLRASLGEAETAEAGGKVTAQAKGDFEKAFAGDPKLGLAEYYLGLAAEQAGDDKKAIATYEAVLGKVQDHPQWVAIINEKLATLKHETPAAPTKEADAGGAANSGGNPPDMIQGMVSRLASRIDKNGGTADEWLRLIRSYAVLGQPDKAKVALASSRKAHGADAKAAADFDAIEKELHLDGSAPASVAEAPAKPAEPATPAGAAAASAAPADAAKNPPDMIQGMVSRLASRIDKNGGAADEWLRLIRSYAVLGQPDKAKVALASARKAHGADAKAAADFDAIEKEFHLDGSAPVSAAEAPAKPAEPATPAGAAAGSAAPADAAKNPPDLIQGMVSRLATRIEQKGGNAEEWLELIRSYAVLQEWDKAKAALASARKALGGDAKAVASLDAITKEFRLDTSAPAAASEASAPPAEPVTAAPPAAEAGGPPNASLVGPDQIQGMVSRLAARLEKNGGTADEWLRLIRSYAVLEQPDKAKAALASARKAAGADPKANADLDAIAQEFHLSPP